MESSDIPFLNLASLVLLYYDRMFHTSGKKIEDPFLLQSCGEQTRHLCVSRPRSDWSFVRCIHDKHNGTSSINIVWMTPSHTVKPHHRDQPTLSRIIPILNSAYDCRRSNFVVTCMVILCMVCCLWLPYIITRDGIHQAGLGNLYILHLFI